MLLEVLLALPLRSRVVAAPAPRWAEGLASWLLDGAWRPEVREAEAGAGGVLARLHRAAKGLDPGARTVAADGASEGLDTVLTAPPGDGLEAVPGPWADGLLAGVARVSLRSGPLAVALESRFAARSTGRVPPLRVVLRAVRADLLPGDGDDPTYEAELERALCRPGAFADWRDGLVLAGEPLASAVAAGFADATDGPAEHRVRVRLLERTEGSGDLLRGLPPGTARQLAAAAACFRAQRPPVEVLRHRRDGGVELWRGEAARD